MIRLMSGAASQREEIIYLYGAIRGLLSPSRYPIVDSYPLSQLTSLCSISASEASAAQQRPDSDTGAKQEKTNCRKKRE